VRINCRIVNFVFLYVLLGYIWPLESSAVDESQEPALEYFIDIGGQTHSARIGEAVRLNGVFTNPNLSIRASDVRRFSVGGIAFEYPAYFTWEAETGDEGYKNWTLSGRDFKIMYFRLNNRFSPQAYAESMLKKFEGTTPRDAERKFSRVTLQGKSFSVTSGGHKMSNEAFAIKVTSGSGLLVFQDSPQQGRQSSTEGTTALSIISRSFQLQ